MRPSGNARRWAELVTAGFWAGVGIFLGSSFIMCLVCALWMGELKRDAVTVAREAVIEQMAPLQARWLEVAQEARLRVTTAPATAAYAPTVAMPTMVCARRWRKPGWVCRPSEE